MLTLNNFKIVDNYSNEIGRTIYVVQATFTEDNNETVFSGIKVWKDNDEWHGGLGDMEPKDSTVSNIVQQGIRHDFVNLLDAESLTVINRTE